MRGRRERKNRRSSSSEATLANNDEAFMINNHGRLYNGKDYSSRIDLTMAEAKLIRIRLELDHIKLKMCDAAFMCNYLQMAGSEHGQGLYVAVGGAGG